MNIEWITDEYGQNVAPRYDLTTELDKLALRKSLAFASWHGMKKESEGLLEIRGTRKQIAYLTQLFNNTAPKVDIIEDATNVLHRRVEKLEQEVQKLEQINREPVPGCTTSAPPPKTEQEIIERHERLKALVGKKIHVPGRNIALTLLGIIDGRIYIRRSDGIECALDNGENALDWREWPIKETGE